MAVINSASAAKKGEDQVGPSRMETLTLGRRASQGITPAGRAVFTVMSSTIPAGTQLGRYEIRSLRGTGGRLRFNSRKTHGYTLQLGTSDHRSRLL
ncbi:MAG: hypothetical protein ACR2HX_13045 [Pyrinomonadaceae bacterium]|nr:hypothetical protein [Pyrinomonadaceae bacterium]